jgi:transposase
MGESTAKKEQKAGPESVELSRSKERAVVAMMAHPSIAEAAKVAGVSESSIWRWLQDDSFQARLRDAQSKVMDGALSSLQGSMTSAVNCLVRNLNCGTPAAEVQAAKTILDFTLKTRQQFDYLERIKALEAALRAREDAEKDGGA